MTAHPRTAKSRVALVAAAALLSACGDASAPERGESDFLVHVYVESGDTTGFSAADVPLRATVTVDANDAEFVRADSTGADGAVLFPQVPSGQYVVSHEVTELPPGVSLVGSWRQTVVAPFAGDSVLTRFVYRFDPGALAGIAYRDANGSGEFEEGVDVLLADVGLLLFAGADTTAAPVAEAATGAAGTFEIGSLVPRDYALLVRPTPGNALAGANPVAVTILPNDTTEVALRLVAEDVATAP